MWRQQKVGRRQRQPAGPPASCVVLCWEAPREPQKALIGSEDSDTPELRAGHRQCMPYLVAFQYETTQGNQRKQSWAVTLGTPEVCNPSIAHLQAPLGLQGTLPSLVKFDPHTGSKPGEGCHPGVRRRDRLREAEILPEAAQLATGQMESRRMHQREKASGVGWGIRKGTQKSQTQSIHFKDEETGPKTGRGGPEGRIVAGMGMKPQGEGQRVHVCPSTSVLPRGLFPVNEGCVRVSGGHEN